jgi:DNA polymerase
MTQAWMDEHVHLKDDPNFRSRYRRFRHLWSSCTACQIGEKATKHCIARGEIPCDILFIGEGPGKTEDVVGTPFVGMAGRLFSEWLFDLREEFPMLRIALTNLVCCRPIDVGTKCNRQPTLREMQRCSTRLKQFFALAQPKAICLLGRLAQSRRPEIDLAWPSIDTCDFLELYHPAFHLRNGRKSKSAMRDREKLFVFCEQKFGVST